MILQSGSDGAQAGMGLGSPVKWWNDVRQKWRNVVAGGKLEPVSLAAE